MRKILVGTLPIMLFLFGCGVKMDLNEVFQLTLDLPELQPYYHAEDAPDRVPLVVVKNQFAEKVTTLEKFGQPVRLLSREEIRANTITAYFEFAAVIEKKDKSLIVNFRYPIEGVVGEVLLKKTEGNWKIADHVIVEQ